VAGGHASESCRVRFLPDGQVTAVPCGMTVAEAAGRAGVFIALPCAGRGTCGHCRVRVVEGALSPPTLAEQQLLAAADLAAGYRLACQARIGGAATIEVLDTSRTLERKEIRLLQTRRFAFAPEVVQVEVEVPPASLADQRSDLARLRAVLPCPCEGPVALGALQALPQAVRAAQGKVRVTTIGERLVAVAPTSVPSGAYGAAVDLGTTTVVGYLFDLRSGEYLASAASYNPQAQHGADVIARISHATATPSGRHELQAEAIGVVNQVLREAAAAAGVSSEDIFEVVLVGNTCMHHFFWGIDPSYLGRSPYVPAVGELVEGEARALGLAICPEAKVVWLPLIAGFVGADTVGVILATELTARPHAALAVDLGTNGEVALWTGEGLLVTSCAAGPAFEGAQIRDGMRASPGAIEHVTTRDGDLAISTIGGEPAVGICGSGLFDAVAVLLELGVVDASGRLRAADGLPAALAARVQGEGVERYVVLARPEETREGRPIVLTQRDVRQLQLAKAAVRAAVELLLAEAGLRAEEVGEVLLAGAFGNYVNPRSIVRMGLLPPVVGVERIHSVGNAAGAGAALALLSLPERERACALARQAVHVELFNKPQFQEVLAEAMLFG
jgi:uncharacterized 2Fe-2S/4Fe-4S cluster protein (DUF4445 family)